MTSKLFGSEFKAIIILPANDVPAPELIKKIVVWHCISDTFIWIGPQSLLP